MKEESWDSGDWDSENGFALGSDDYAFEDYLQDNAPGYNSYQSLENGWDSGTGGLKMTSFSNSGSAEKGGRAAGYKRDGKAQGHVPVLRSKRETSAGDLWAIEQKKERIGISDAFFLL